jgi:hypothetical protein
MTSFYFRDLSVAQSGTGALGSFKAGYSLLYTLGHPITAATAFGDDFKSYQAVIWRPVTMGLRITTWNGQLILLHLTITATESLQ